MLDMLLAIIFSVIFSLLMGVMVAGDFAYDIAILILPIIWLSFRYGPWPAIVAGALAGLISGILEYGLAGWADIFMYNVLPLVTVGISGIFAKYTQKTLNNHRYSSTYLNIATGSLLSSLLYFLSKYPLASYIYGNENPFPMGQLEFWANIAITWFVVIVVIILVARINPSFLIPKRSRFLSRKETSSLLND